MLKIEGLQVTYTHGNRRTYAVRGIDLQAGRGETLALVGESGCGKSTTGRVIAGIERPTKGTVSVADQSVERIAVQRDLRHLVQMVFQNSEQALDRSWNVAAIIGEPLRRLRRLDPNQTRSRIVEALEAVGLDSEYLTRRPGDLSGGQTQRVAIARAVVSEPELIVLDEPTASLDQTVRARVLLLLERLQRARQITYIFISHDLASVRRLATRVAVMYLGRIIEIGDTEQIFARPLHPYTRGLLDSEPSIKPGIPWTVSPMKGETPSAMVEITGCAFRDRCPIATEHCSTVDPKLTSRDAGRSIACLNQ